MEYLIFSKNINRIITCMFKLHLYFTARRILSKMEKGQSMHDIAREFPGIDELYNKMIKFSGNLITILGQVINFVF